MQINCHTLDSHHTKSGKDRASDMGTVAELLKLQQVDLDLKVTLTFDLDLGR